MTNESREPARVPDIARAGGGEIERPPASMDDIAPPHPADFGAFVEMCRRLESVPFNRSKPEILAAYLRDVSQGADANAETEPHPGGREVSWALYLLLGGQLPALTTQAELREWVLAETGLPSWLMDESLKQSGDLAEAAALLSELVVPEMRARATSPRTLGQWIEQELVPLEAISVRARLRAWWSELPSAETWAVHALLLGRFPTHVSRRVAEDALEIAFGLESPLVGDGLAARLAELPIPRGAQVKPLPPAQMDLF